MKAFLSHNSFDKDFVGRVFEKLGAALAVYDKVTFAKNCDLAEQISKGLSDSEVYVLFLSRGAVESGWVSNELDLANELKTRWKLKRFLIFQLDSTSWSELPAWASRYVVSCPPSPEHVALRIRDELKKEKLEEKQCYGRDLDVQAITEQILERDVVPSFLFLSGPDGIGRRTLADAVYKTLYDEVSAHKLTVTFGAHDDIDFLYRQLLGFSANWRAAELVEASRNFQEKSVVDKIAETAYLIYEITVDFRQVLVLDMGRFGFGTDDKPLSWVINLLSMLPSGDYPYLILLSSRFMDIRNENGICYSVSPLDVRNSQYLFKILLSRNGIVFPNKNEKDIIENSVIGHAGLISMVVNYLKVNPNYRPNKTHNSIVQLIRVEIEKMLLDFISSDQELERVVGLFGEASIISYAEIIDISNKWTAFDEKISKLIDAGFLLEIDGNYQLAAYLQRHAQKLAEKHFTQLAEARKILFESTESLGESDFVPVSLLDSRIVAYFISGTPVPAYLTNLVMPIQLLKAARREYDNERYDRALELSKDAYSQSEKLSESGTLEAWRLIGLAACRIPSNEDFLYFEQEYQKINASTKRDTVFDFAHGFKARLAGDLKKALPHLERIKKRNMADAHALRELAFIYAFEGRYDLASDAISQARRLGPSNPYIIDMQAFVLLEQYRRTKEATLLRELDACIERLEEADARENTNFSRIRKGMREVFAHNHLDEMRVLFNSRSSLPLHAKFSLLDTLGAKGRWDQFEQLASELQANVKKNPLADIELARIRIIYFAFDGKISDAEHLLNRYRHKFTDYCIQFLQKQILDARARTGAK